MGTHTLAAAAAATVLRKLRRDPNCRSPRGTHRWLRQQRQDRKRASRRSSIVTWTIMDREVMAHPCRWVVYMRCEFRRMDELALGIGHSFTKPPPWN